MAIRLSAEKISRENRIFATDDIEGMLALLCELEAEVAEYIECGAARPYYFLDIVDAYLARATESECANLSAGLLDYKNRRFDAMFIDEAEEDLADFEFEFRDPYIVEKYAPGQHIQFGNYPSTKYGDVRPIDWRILDVMGTKALLITNGVVECKKYDPRMNLDLSWEESDLRAFLNGEYAASAFNDMERSQLLDVSLTNGRNPKFGTEGGADTVDKVFLLSLDEVDQYFADDFDRRSIGTDFAKRKSMNLGPSGYSWWWLRSPGHSKAWASYVFDDGVIFYYGDYVYNHYGGVRPCICVDLRDID